MKRYTKILFPHITTISSPDTILSRRLTAAVKIHQYGLEAAAPRCFQGEQEMHLYFDT